MKHITNSNENVRVAREDPTGRCKKKDRKSPSVRAELAQLKQLCNGMNHHDNLNTEILSRRDVWQTTSAVVV